MKEDALYRKIKDLRKDIERIREENEKFGQFLKNLLEYPYVDITWDDQETEIVKLTVYQQLPAIDKNKITYFPHYKLLATWDGLNGKGTSVYLDSTMVDPILNEMFKWIKSSGADFNSKLLLQGIEDD